jgi:hypothetical protein
MENNKRPLKIALHGMGDRTVKTMMLFLQGPCSGAAYVVINPEDADVDIFDSDSSVSKILLEQNSQSNSNKPVIVFSVQDFVQEGILNVTKPVKTSEMLKVLEQAKTIIAERSIKAAERVMPPDPKAAEKDVLDLFNYSLTQNQDAPVPQTKPEEATQPPVEPEQPVLKTFVADQGERSKTAKHQTAMRLDEKSFNELIGGIDGLDANGPKQFINDANYNPKDYFQGFFQAAIAEAKINNQIMLLESSWWPITLFPRTQEIWLEAGDIELKGFAGIQLNRKTKTAELFLTPVDPQKMDIGGALDKFQNMDAFLWKLACWTSRGRYPQEIDFKLPVYLKNWPNFTRLVITPHALRIASLLIQGPRTMVNVAQALNIRPQYVFVFVSAAYAVGLVGQARRAEDVLVQAPDIQPSKAKGLLGRIMSKLRGN